jgi:hypothetical protein
MDLGSSLNCPPKNRQTTKKGSSKLLTY